MNPELRPAVSIVMPVYRSDKTLAACLRTMVAQRYRPLEIVVVDSSPEQTCEEIVRAEFPQVRYHHSRARLYPHQARNLGIGLASGELILSTDPDIYAPVDWVETMVDAYLTYWGVIVGSYHNYGDDHIDLASHLCKFDMWLPGGEARRIEIGPTANVLYPRAFIEAVGLFNGPLMLGDTKTSWDVQRIGIPLIFVPQAVVEHHHTSTVGGLLQERYQRAQEFAKLRINYFDWDRKQIVSTLLMTPLRLVKQFVRTAICAWRAKMTADFMVAAPVVLAGHAAWLAGEAWGYLRALREGLP